ncbi:MAG TPA: hypothetical protein PLG47_03105 [Candidatus Dojkabacteria bacterium]|nr:hypothetical protein [Candidatus Dojkabacteria bacterium]
MDKNKNETDSQKSFVLTEDTLSPDIPLREEISLVAKYYAQEIIDKQEKESKIHIDEIASGVAKFYEQIRKIIDWKDDNALRRGAIERILKRRLLPKMITGSFTQDDSLHLAQTMTEELIRGGHLPNHEVPRSRVEVVSDSLNKYLYFLEYSIRSYGITNVKKVNEVTIFLIEIASCEIEEVLTRPAKEYGIMEVMSKIMNERIKVEPENILKKDAKLDLIRVSVQRKLYHLDDNYIVYMYLRRKYPNWDHFSQEELKEFAQNLESIQKSSEEYINSKICKKFDEIISQYSAVFVLLDDVFDDLKDSPKSIEKNINDKSLLLSLITDNYNKRRDTLKRTLRNSAIFSTLSVFLSNWVTFYLIEVPVARLFYEEFNLLATIVDFLLPALVMFLLVIFIKPPKEDNLDKVLKASEDLLYDHPKYEIYEIKLEENTSPVGKLVISSFYIISTILLFVGIGFLFYVAKLPMTSVVYDTFTIAVTFSAALAVRNKSKELQVGESGKFGEFLFDIFTVPVAKVGTFLSSKWKEYNVVAIFTNYLVEVPFVAILNFIELWSKFIKERKAEIK